MSKHKNQILSSVILLIISLAIVFTASACGPKAPAGEVKTGSAEGFAGDIKVQVTVDNGKITGLIAEGASETPTIGGEALPKLVKAILEKGSIEGVDAVAGATYTSEGLFNAVKTALGIEVKKEEPAVEKKEETPLSDSAVTTEGKADGFEGKIKVKVTTDGGKIVRLTAEGPDETPSIGGKALPKLVEAVLAKGTIEGVDVVAGATYTSNGFFDAVKAALAGDTQTEEKQAEEKQPEIVTPAPAGSVTKTGKAEGFGGDIKVSVTTKSGKIVGLTADGADETPAIGGKALTKLVSAILAKGSINGVDAVSGATYTSNGLFNAIKTALGQKTEEKTNTNTTPVTPKDDKTDKDKEKVTTGTSSKFGFGVAFTTSAKSATADKAGSAEQDIYMCAILVDKDGKLVDCKFDVAQDKLAVSAEGVVTDKNATFQTKQEKGDAYGMRKASKIGKEWNEQADALANFYVGKTQAQIKALAKDDAGKYTDVDLLAGCTMGHMESFEAALNDAFARLVDAEGAANIGIGTWVSAADSTDATAEKDGSAYFYTYMTGNATDKSGKAVACIIDAAQVKFAVKADGTVTAPTNPQSKDQLKDAYGMKKASKIGKEWYEQAAFLAESLKGKTKNEVAATKLDGGKAVDADLLAGCTMGHLTDILTAVTNGMPSADRSFGFGVAFTTSAKSATADAAGSAEQDIYMCSILVDGNGKIVECKFDVAQDKLAVSATGAVTNKDAVFQTKQEKGDAYGMRKASAIGKEWNEQADALANFYVGKTQAQIKALAKDDAGKYTDVDLLAGCTMGHMETFEEALFDAFARLVDADGATNVGIGTWVSAADSTDATAEKDGSAYFYTYMTGNATDDAGEVAACIIDAAQVKFAVKADGTVTAPENPKSKDQLKDAYGMKKASKIGKEWYEQAAFLASSLKGKTKSEVAGIKLDGGKAVDADLLAGCTMGHLADILTAVTNGMPNADRTFGFGVAFTTSAKSATADKAGSAEQDIYMCSIIVDGNGKIVECKFDVAQDKLAVSATGAVTDKNATFQTKQEKGDAYGMRKASKIGKEWNEQADALAEFYVGKTESEIKVLAKDDAGKYTDVDLLAGCTMGHMETFEEALFDAFDRLVEANGAANVGIGTWVSAADSTDATADKDGSAYFYTYMTGNATDKDGKVVACIIDAAQVKFAVKADGTVTAPTDPQSKDQLKDAYGMKKASKIGKEWYEQAAFLADSLEGKTKAEIAATKLDGGKAVDADLLAGCTMGHLSDILTAVTNGIPAAKRSYGFGVAFTTSAKSATADKAGSAEQDIYMCSILVDENGKIVECKFDVAQDKLAVSATGAVTDKNATFQTKQEKGDAYGMRKASKIGKEWNEQADALANYYVGKTQAEIKALAKDDAGKYTDVDLLAGCTMGHMETFEEALNDAFARLVEADDAVSVGIGTRVSAADSTDATAEKDGSAYFYTYMAGNATDAKGKVVACIIDAAQVKFAVKADGTVTAPANPQSKDQLKDAYGMKKASKIEKEWYQQAESLANYLVGKTKAEVAGVKLADGKATDVDLLAGCTMGHLGDILDAVTAGM